MRRNLAWLALLLLPLLLPSCAPSEGAPTRAVAAFVSGTGVPGLPATWTAAPPTLVRGFTPAAPGRPSREPTRTPRPIPTNTPYTPPPTQTPTLTPTATSTVTPEMTPTPVIKPLGEYEPAEVIPVEAFPRPADDNGWGIHWIPTVKQEPGVVDRFVSEAIRMHIKWVVFLNDGTNIGDNDYLVSRLVESGIMPVMRLYRSTLTPYDGDLRAVVAHYRARGVHYFQLYNEPNVNIENRQGFANPVHYAAVWADAARDVLAAGGLPGIGALSPGGAYDHYAFLNRTLLAIKYNGDEALLQKAWLSVHNYHGTRPHDDPDGFLLFRNYDGIVRTHLLRSMPMIGTEGGSYSSDPEVVKRMLAFQYNYMKDAEPYFFAFSYWIIANQAGGSFDTTWEWQVLFRHDGSVHPAVTDYFYRGN